MFVQSLATAFCHVPTFPQILFAACIVFFTLAGVSDADRIVLRDLTILSDKTVSSFNEDGVRLGEKTRIGWDRIEAGKVDPNQQADFDKMLMELGGPLFRIRQRLSVGDFPGLVSHAESLYPRYMGRSSETAYMVLQAVMWGRLAEGKAEAALAPYLYCYNCLRALGTINPPLQGTRRLKLNPRTGLTSELPPVWFNQQAAAAEVPHVYQAIQSMSRVPIAVYVYYAAIALAADQQETATKVLEGKVLQGRELPAEIRDLAIVLRSQQQIQTGKPSDEISVLEKAIPGLQNEARPLALYWLGRAKSLSKSQDVRREGALELLRLPAKYAQDNPRLAAAGLYQAWDVVQTSKDKVGAEIIRQELLQKYGKTYFAAELHKRAGSD